MTGCRCLLFSPPDIPTLMKEVRAQGVITTVKGVAIGNGCWGTVAGTNCGDVGK